MEAFLNTSDKGFIYFSLGTNVKSHFISLELRTLFLNVFAKLPYSVLWKYDADDFSNIPMNVRIQKWYPQEDVLRKKFHCLIFDPSRKII